MATSPSRSRALALAALAAAAGCGGSEQETKAPQTVVEGPPTTSIEIAELEILPGGVDRYTSCPPPGELGQDWIPKVAPWAPPKSAEKTAANEPAGLPPPPPDGRTPTEKAIFDTYPEFRRCYQKGLLHDPTQDGRAAIVLRVGPDGRVGHVETYGVCALSAEVVTCMRDAARHLRFEPPAAGSETLTIPAVFETRGGRASPAPSPNDAYTAAAYVTLEYARPDLHACEANARRAGQELQASATLLIELDGAGHVVHTHVDPWQGNQEMLACAAHAIEKLTFDKPPAGRGSVLARISFNPRAGTK